MTAPDEARFAALYDAHVGTVRQLCLGFCRGRPDVADDLSQEVFVQVWRHLGRFRGEASAKTWITRIAVNTCLRYGRSRARRADEAAELPPELPGGATADDHADDPRFEALYRAIGTLPEVDRLIYMLTLDGQTNAQIANVTGLSAGALRVRLHRANRKLRELLRHAA